MATDLQLRLLSVFRTLEARFVFDELAAEQQLLRSPPTFDRERATSEDFRAALEVAIDENTLPESRSSPDGSCSSVLTSRPGWKALANRWTAASPAGARRRRAWMKRR